MFVPVYENRRVTGSPLAAWADVLAGSLLGLLLLALLGLGLLGLVLDGLGLLGRRQAGAPVEEPASPLLQAVVLAALLGLAAWTLQATLQLARRHREARRWLASGQELACAVGPVSFSADDDSGAWLAATVGGTRFDLTWCTRRGRSTPDYRWRTSSTIRGEVRAFFVPTTRTLVRAEWRSFDAGEIVARVDAAISAARAWSPDIAARVPAAAGDPRVLADCRRVVERFRALIEEDCGRLEALKPALLPGRSRRARERAEERLDTILTRIAFTKSTVMHGLRAAGQARA